MPRSLLDEVDLPAVRAAASARAGPGATVLSCLMEGGVLGVAADDPDWPDRDRLVVGSAPLAELVAGTGVVRPDAVLEGARALAVAAGLALGSAVDGGVARVFCVLGADALADGLLWEAAVAAAQTPLVAVMLVDALAASRARALFESVGWCVAATPADRPVDVLGALDRVCERGGSSAGAVLAVTS